LRIFTEIPVFGIKIDGALCTRKFFLRRGNPTVSLRAQRGNLFFKIALLAIKNADFDDCRPEQAQRVERVSPLRRLTFTFYIRYWTFHISLAARISTLSSSNLFTPPLREIICHESRLRVLNAEEINTA
jgi:hypothetical protein